MVKLYDSLREGLGFFPIFGKQKWGTEMGIRDRNRLNSYARGTSPRGRLIFKGIFRKKKCKTYIYKCTAIVRVSIIKKGY